MKRLLFFVLFAALAASAQNLRVDGIALNRGGMPAPGANVAVCSQPAITAASEVGTLATITSSLNPGAGVTVNISGVTPIGYNGQWTTVSSSPTQFTFTASATGLGVGTLFGSTVAIGPPCAPQVPLCTSLTDNVCSQTQPIVSDGLGNYTFYVPATAVPYTLQIYGSGLSARVQPDQAYGSSSAVLLAANNNYTGVNTFANINGTRVAGTATYPTIQSAITSACAASPHAEVFVPTAAYTQNSAFTLCSNLKVYGAGSVGSATVGGAHVTTNMTSATLWQLGGLVDVELSNIWNTSTAVSGSSVCIGDFTGTAATTWMQGIKAHRFYCDGGFARGLDLEVFAASAGSVISNHFEDFQITLNSPASVGCDLNANDAVTKVINSNVFINPICAGGTGASFGMRTIGGSGGGSTFINENTWIAPQFYTNGGVAAGSVGVNLTANSSWNMIIIGATIEGNGVGLRSAGGNQATCYSCEVSVNTQNFDDLFHNISLKRGRGTELVLQNDYTDAAGNTEVNGLGLGVLGQPNSLAIKEGGAPTLTGGQDICYGDIVSHLVRCSYNADAALAMPRVIAYGASTLGSTSVTTLTCSTAITVSVPGALVTDKVVISFTAMPAFNHDALMPPQGIVSPNGTLNIIQCNNSAATVARDGLGTQWMIFHQ
jgi:hypothetical protein